MLKFYGYKKCSTCRDAEKALQSKKLAYEYIDITTQPPGKDELTQWIKTSGVDVKTLLNTSGEVYRDMGLKDRVKSMAESEIIALLATHGRLIKRPLITDGQRILPRTEWRT